MGGHGYSSLSVFCLFVCLFVCDTAHLAHLALRLQPSHNKLLVLTVTDFYVKASLVAEASF